MENLIEHKALTLNQTNLKLTQEHIINLKRIYESENESLHKTGFIDEDGNPHPDFERVISELVAMDYIETENDENVFFLTTSGYDCVEALLDKKVKTIPERREIKFEQLTKMIHKFGVKRFKKYIFVWLMSFGIIVAVYKYYFPTSFQKKKPLISKTLTDEMLNDIKKQVQQKTDSIKKHQMQQ